MTVNCVKLRCIFYHLSLYIGVKKGTKMLFKLEYTDNIKVVLYYYSIIDQHIKKC